MSNDNNNHDNNNNNNNNNNDNNNNTNYIRENIVFCRKDAYFSNSSATFEQP